MVLPRLSSLQMNNISGPQQGMLIYNSTEHQLYGYMRYRTDLSFGNNRWQPISTGPRTLAWGVVDSFTTIMSGSENFSVAWDVTNRWYRLDLTNPHEYYKDSMLLMITPVGNGTHDQMPSTGEIIETSGRVASIKFIDATRVTDPVNFNTLTSRRRSGFHFILYDLRKSPY